MTPTLSPQNKIKGKLRQFGRGPAVSIFTLGTMRAIGSVDQMYSVLKAASIAGINHIETAPAYGPAESFLGKAINKLKQEKIEPKHGWVITSKIFPGLSLEEGKKELKRILKRLDLKRLDNLAIHGLNLNNHLEWVLEGEGSKLLQWAKEENLVGQVGFSSHGSFSLIQKAIESNRFQFCSLHLHLLDPRKIPLAKIALRKGMGVMAISPADKGGRLQSPSSTLVRDCYPFAPLELAYKFLLEKGISTLTLGAYEPKDINLARKIITSGPLTMLEKNTIKNLRDEGNRRLGKDLCGQCEKCLPCPNSVPIPEILRLRNLLIGHDLTAFTEERYNLIGKAGHWWEELDASACKSCGECVPRCPNNLNIPKLLEETHERLAAKPRKRLWG
ncbi:aldo/keto reductase [Prochlorococcus sp. MIT 1307]|uniref:aldo/keto reductase n=1 Tax=Prochlorococcus sp. MIT 1307 TaxID=3096219 RepID=UPI002A764373|nr:aldo/keto reductase [Prochlorococcus sp. MIT 1307]